MARRSSGGRTKLERRPWRASPYERRAEKSDAPPRAQQASRAAVSAAILSARHVPNAGQPKGWRYTSALLGIRHPFPHEPSLGLTARHTAVQERVCQKEQDTPKAAQLVRLTGEKSS